MKFIDMHMHLTEECTDEKIAEYVEVKRDKEHVKKAVLIGPRPDKKGAHERLMEVCTAHKDFFVPYARIDLTSPDKVDVGELLDMGCVGLKFINPYVDYDHISLFPIYEKAEELSMPILFHTGIIAGSDDQPGGIRGVSTARMKPEFLDTVARAFPDLVVHGAHLGNPWYDISFEIMRYNRNIYWDICGTTLTKKMTPAWWNRLQWEKESRKQFIYGTDEIPLLPEEGEASHYTTGIETHMNFIDRIGWTEEEKEGYFYKNARGILENAYNNQGKDFSWE